MLSQSAKTRFVPDMLDTRTYAIMNAMDKKLEEILQQRERLSLSFLNYTYWSLS